ncbi:uncharacterized protein LOC123316424 isoform X2 [Coccinella septempunctata]|nr:uncharacterized protein LOC123316424 isoform X2 [Coccinella septempunctata]
MDKNTCCQICVKEFFKVSNLRRHIKRFHPESFQPLPKKQFAFTCDVCGKNFSYIRNYRCHLKTHDPNAPSSKVMKKCPLCAFLSEKAELYEHFEKDHDIRLITEQLNFDDTDSFLKWKLTLENDSGSHFVRNYTQQTKCYDEVILYVCHRSGHTFPKGENMNKVGNDNMMKKIGGFCPASIKMMKKKDGSVLASFLETHIGHIDEEDTGQGDTTKKLKSIMLRHKNSSNLAKDSLVKSDDVWQFHSRNKEEIYVISINENQCCSDCPFTCLDCKACIHKYSCSCKDWTVKWNMCVHIHLLCRLLNEEQEKNQEQILTQRSNSSLDITDLIIYDGANTGGRDNERKSPIIIQEVSQEVSVEAKNIILREFSDIIVKCNSPSLFQEIVTIVGGLKARVECEEILAPTQDFIAR